MRQEPSQKLAAVVYVFFLFFVIVFNPSGFQIAILMCSLGGERWRGRGTPSREEFGSILSRRSMLLRRAAEQRPPVAPTRSYECYMTSD